ncbi:MAG: metal-dependent hydrolase [Candidatus Dadabacteria bacterium]
MFIGHYGAAFSIKKVTPAISLGVLFLAVQFLDLLWPTLLLLNVEHVEIAGSQTAPVPLVFTDYPYSHSMVMALAWSFAFGVVYWLFKKNRTHAVILGLAVFSHWVLDLLVHLPDMPLYPGSSIMLGLAMWKFPIITGIIEGSLFVGGILLYMGATKPKNLAGSMWLYVLIALLVISHIANLFSPPPPSVNAVAWAGEAMWLFVILGFLADRNRVAKDAVITDSKRKMSSQEAYAIE